LSAPLPDRDGLGPTRIRLRGGAVLVELADRFGARAAGTPDVDPPVVVRSRIIKERGRLQAYEVPGEPNAETYVERRSDGLYRLTPRTGRTHQLRVHMASLGVPIDNDSLYPHVVEVAADDFTRPLQLLAQTLEFEDPLSGKPRRFTSGRGLCA
jgi:tRNA pseudouridine32 synthase/23S rRNA pseudouridine746 synthase